MSPLYDECDFINKALNRFGWEVGVWAEAEDEAWVEAQFEDQILTLSEEGQVCLNGEVAHPKASLKEGREALLDLAQRIIVGERPSFYKPDPKKLHYGITFDVKRVVVQLTGGADRVYFHTIHASPMPNHGNQPLVLQFDVEEGNGVEYVKKLTGLDPEIIDTRD